ncbi:nose resistant to fluoxetine protein 6-like [Anticarsia gemmatalis]|uniref:nose resistant to fluoxetine protein 6-like n=1 Tax=Anticarsia gemmatalis TaxID=129554 RepID=UPI003F766E13
MWLVLVLAVAAAAGDVTDEEYAKFPRLYHLDDYSSCLSQTDGLYCLGTFHITPLKEQHSIYHMIREYSLDPHHFNRTQLHRGYCVSSRCPTLSEERNASLRFERCASHWARRHALRTTLAKLSYCRTHAQEYARTHNPEPLDIPHRVFLYVLVTLLVMNVMGTLYDAVLADDVKKNPLLAVWSVRGNWQRLTATYEDGDPRLSALSPVQGIRVFLMALIMATHSACIHDMLYLYNPRFVEQVSRHPVLMIFLNGTSVVQVFVMLSNFLLAYNMLLFAKNNRLTLKLLPLITLRRIARISPVYLLVVGYAATWWTRANSGPMWPAMVGAESGVCRDKFWAHAFYLNNLVDPDNICLVQTWFLAVDMQLYLVAAVLTLVLAPLRRRALPILAALVLVFSLLNGILAYIFNWQSLMFFAYPKTLNTMYKGISSFSRLYQSPLASLPGCLIGLFCAFLHFELQEAGVKVASYKWLKVPYHIAPFAMVSWLLSGYYLRQFSEPWFMATYVAVERPVLSMLGAVTLLGMINGLEGWLKHYFSWRGWHAMGRMSLSVLAVHWCINMSIAASRPQPITTSLLSVMVDWIATGWFSYVVAIPLTIMVEMPVQRFITALLS